MTAVVDDLRLDGDGPLYEQIRRALARPIVEGRWEPGHRLPSEHELTGMLGASRMTVNRALSRLAGDGLIVRRRKAGTFVARRSEEHAVMRIADLCEEIRAGGHDYSYRLLDQRVEAADVLLGKQMEVHAGARLLSIECMHFADGSPAIHERRWISLASVPEAADADFAAMAPGPWLLRRVPWTRARHTISAANADETMSASLAIAKGAACLIVERSTWQEGEPVTYVRLTYPGSRHRLVGRFSPGDQ